MPTTELDAVTVAAVLGVDALIHAYWLTGRVWPARDGRSLSRAVLNADVPFTPRVLIPLIVVLSGGAVAVLAKADMVQLGLPSWLLTAAAGAVAAGLFIRGLAGAVWVLGIGSTRETPFYWLNLAAYTPVCLILCAAATAVALR